MTGCLAQRYAAQLEAEMPEADAILGIGHIDELEAVIHAVLEGER